MNWIKILKDILISFSSTLVLILMINVFSIIFQKLYYSSDKYSKIQDVVKSNYAHMDKEDMSILLSNTWNYGWQYEEVLGFREKARKTKFVNVNNLGFRDNISSHHFEESLDDSIWFFGGSTTFGYGVADNETIPAYLEEILAEEVKNLGRGYYYSEQENLLMLQLLKYGYRPRQVIFLDGINERCSVGVYQEQMRVLFDSAQSFYTPYTPIKQYMSDIMKPSLELSAKFLKKIGINPQLVNKNTNKNLHSSNCKKFSRTVPLSKILSYNLHRRKDICNNFRISCITFVQPFAGVHGKHLSLVDLSQEKRKIMEDKFLILRPVFENHNAIFLTAALDSNPNHAYVDDVHYSSKSNFLIADQLANQLTNVNHP